MISLALSRYWLSLLGMFAGQVGAIDLLPGEVVPKPAGMQLVQLIYSDVERKGFYSNGSNTLPAAQVQSEVFQLRYAYAFEVGQHPAVAYVQQPWGQFSSSGLPGGSHAARGMADTIFLLALWPYVDREAGRYLAVAGYYFADNGQYDNRKNVNLGENRHKTALQIAYQARLARDLDWVLAGDVIRFGTNPAFGSTSATLTQATLWTAQTSLNYRLTPVKAVGLSLFRTMGGETSLNGTARNDGTRQNRWLLTGTYQMPTRKQALHLQYGRDFDTENGLLETRRVTLRFTQAF